MHFSVIDGELSLAHAAQICALRRTYAHDTSSHAFHTLYIWRDIVGKKLYLEPDLYTLRYEAKGGNCWLFPCGSVEATCRFIESHLHEDSFSMCYLRNADVEFLQERYPGAFAVTPSPEDSEYLVDRAAHIALTGSRYSKLRGKKNRAEREHTITTQPLNQANIGRAMDVIRTWHGSRKAQGALNLFGDEEDHEPLKKAEVLGITGILMQADGQPYGVAAVYPLSDDTYDLFLAKEGHADPALGYYLRREMIRQLPETVKYVNLEDDLGIEGLRTMKQQMIPVKTNDMWMAKRNEDR